MTPLHLKDAIPDCPDVFENLEVVFEASWSGYEENGWIVIFKFFEEYMVEEYQYSVMADDNTHRFDPYPVTKEYALELQKEWQSNEDNSWCVYINIE